MKKIIVIVSIVVFVLLLAFGGWLVLSDSNGEEAPSPDPTESPTSPTISPTVEPTPTPPDTGSGNGGNDQNGPNDELLRNIPPELIVLSTPEGIAEDLYFHYFLPSYRAVFYMIPGYIDDLIGPESINAWLRNTWVGWLQEPNEMFLLAAIKYFDISKNALFSIAATEEEGNWFLHNAGNINLYNEFYETPNLNLLFTFNNDLINRYYSRDLVVAQAAYNELQEWLQHNEPYESYSAFRAANP